MQSFGQRCKKYSNIHILISCKRRKILLASLGYVVTSNFAATNNKDFEILKDTLWEKTRKRQF